MIDNTIKFVFDKNEYVPYLERIKAATKKPSFGLQFECYLSAQSETQNNEKFVNVIRECMKAKKITIAMVAKAVASRYTSGIDYTEKIASYYYISQVLDKMLRTIVFDTETDENLRNCIANYLRLKRKETQDAKTK